MHFKQFVKIKDGFYKGRRGRLIEKGATKYLVRFRIGLFRVIDAWVDEIDIAPLFKR